MTDLATARAAQELGLADGERREAVVEVEPLVGLVEELVDGLDVPAGAERDHDERLGLAAGEHGRAMHLREVVDLGPDVADLVGLATVEAAALVEDHLAHHAGLGGLERLLDLADAEATLDLSDGVVALAEELRDQVVADLLDAAIEGFLGVLRAQVRVDVVLDVAVDGLDERVVRGDRAVLQRGRGAVLLVALPDELGDTGDDGLDGLEAELQRGDHVVLADLIHLALDHRDRVGLAGHDQVDIGRGPLLRRREEDELTVDAADADVRGRAVERAAREAERGRGADARDHVGVHLDVGGQDVVEDLDLVPEAVREEGPDGAVDETRGEGLLVGGPGLALEEAAGEGALRGEALAVVDREREEVLTVAEVAVGDRRREHDGVAERGDDGAVGLLGELAGLERDGLAADLDGLRDSLGGCHEVLGCGPVLFGP